MRNRLRTICLAAALAAPMLMTTGCQKPLFPEDEARTPYERYQILRGRERRAEKPNPFGVSEPALRERLRPLGDP